jgi:hypothetical protein
VAQMAGNNIYTRNFYCKIPSKNFRDSLEDREWIEVAQVKFSDWPLRL